MIGMTYIVIKTTTYLESQNFMQKALLTQLRCFGMAYRVQPKKKALASTNLNVFLAAPDSI